MTRTSLVVARVIGIDICKKYCLKNEFIHCMLYQCRHIMVVTAFYLNLWNVVGLQQISCSSLAQRSIRSYYDFLSFANCHSGHDDQNARLGGNSTKISTTAHTVVSSFNYKQCRTFPYILLHFSPGTV